MKSCGMIITLVGMDMKYHKIGDIFLAAWGKKQANRWDSGREHEPQTRHLKLGDGVAIPPIQDDPTVTG